MPRLATTLLALLALAAGLLALLFLVQRRLLYFPRRYPAAVAHDAARALGLTPWVVDGEIHGYRRAAPGARGTLVVLHGNAGAALDRTYVADALAVAEPAAPLDVLLVEYPGYGPRPGAPTEASLVAAAREAIRAAAPAGPVIVVGESLGSAVAALAAAEAPAEIRGLVLVTPLASVTAVARRHYPWAPALLVRDPLRADRALPRYGGPVAFVVAGRDEVVFTDLGLALHAAYPGPKALWVEAGATHDTLDWRPGAPRWREVIRFATGAP